MSLINQIKRLYAAKRGEIVSRLKEFEWMRLRGSDEEIFAELAFCILTPQSKAKLCWQAVERLREKNLLLKGGASQIRPCLRGVRFDKKKAGYIASARKLFADNGRVSLKPLLKQFSDVFEIRERLVKNVCGLGYKEASHFLRNIGLGERIAILDRHILRNLKELGVIRQIPETMSRARYLEIEKDMDSFARRINMPLSHLDLLLWCKETGEVFK